MDPHLSDRLDRIEKALGMLRHPLPPVAMKVSEVAQNLHLSPATVRRLIESGALRAAKIQVGQRSIYRIEQKDLADFIERQKNHLPEPVKMVTLPAERYFSKPR